MLANYRKLGEGAFGTVYGGESFFDEKGWVSKTISTINLYRYVQYKNRIQTGRGKNKK